MLVVVEVEGGVADFGAQGLIAVGQGTKGEGIRHREGSFRMIVFWRGLRYTDIHMISILQEKIP